MFPRIRFRPRVVLLGLAGFLGVAALAVCAAKFKRAKDRDATVSAIERIYGTVVFDYQVDASGQVDVSAKPNGPEWLRTALGTDLFAEVNRISLGGHFLDLKDVTNPAAIHIISSPGLHADDRDFEGILDGIQYFSALEYFDSRDFVVRDAHSKRLCGFPMLRYLLPRNCTGVTDAGVEHLAKLPHLRVLSLNDAQLSDAGLAHLARLNHLERLELNGTNITDAGLQYLSVLRRLKALDLRNTSVGDAGMIHLSNLTELRHLFLTNTEVTDRCFVHFRKLRHLDLLHLGGTRVTRSGADKFEEGLPASPIVR